MSILTADPFINREHWGSESGKRNGTALVTGASRGIGRAIAGALAADGWNLILTCLKTLPELREFSSLLEQQYEIEVRSCLCDMGNPDDVRDLFGGISSLDLLINNAGIAWVGLLQDMTDADWNRIVATNLSSVFYTSRAAIPLFLKKGADPAMNSIPSTGQDLNGLTGGPGEAGAAHIAPDRGRIINISSVWGNVGASCEAAYSATKGGVNSLTKALAKELAPSGIPVNAIACGCVDTVMNDNLSPEEKADLADEIPIGRFAEPSEIAAAVLQLVHSPAYLTGQIITVDGGWI